MYKIKYSFCSLISLNIQNEMLVTAVVEVVCFLLFHLTGFRIRVFSVCVCVCSNVSCIVFSSCIFPATLRDLHAKLWNPKAVFCRKGGENCISLVLNLITSNFWQCFVSVRPSKISSLCSMASCPQRVDQCWYYNLLTASLMFEEFNPVNSVPAFGLFFFYCIFFLPFFSPCNLRLWFNLSFYSLNTRFLC